MVTRRRFVQAATAGSLLLAGGGPGPGRAQTTQGGFAKVTTLRIAGYQGDASVHTRALRRFAETLAPKMGVEMIPDITKAGQPAATLLTQVESGEIDGCYFASSYLAGRIPALGLFDIPFAATDRAETYGRLDGATGDRLASAVAAASRYRVLGFWDNGFRHLSNRLRAIRTPADCRGLKLRTLDNALHQEVFAALGFVPMTIDVKDLPAAVANQTVDAQENPLTNLVNFNLHATHRFVSLTAHFLGVALLLVNRARYEALSPAEQEHVTAAARSATAAQRAFAAAEDERCLAVLRQAGVTITGPDEIDFAAFRAALTDIVARETARAG
jgi:C4-dicarboxylate-binding protein DctP